MDIVLAGNCSWSFTVAGLSLHGCAVFVTRQVTKDFRELYKDNVVVEVLTVPAPEKPLVRKSRSLLQATSPTLVRPGSVQS